MPSSGVFSGGIGWPESATVSPECGSVGVVPRHLQSVGNFCCKIDLFSNEVIKRSAEMVCCICVGQHT